MKFYARSVTASTALFISLFIALASNCALAQTKPTAKKTVNVAPAKKARVVKETEVAMISAAHDDLTPDIVNSTTNDYKCELNDSLTIYTHKEDDSRAALRWKNKLYSLKRVDTTTGANRFENKKAGLVWIGIPTKGMLLDSIRGQQLANECKTASQ